MRHAAGIAMRASQTTRGPQHGAGSKTNILGLTFGYRSAAVPSVRIFTSWHGTRSSPSNSSTSVHEGCAMPPRVAQLRRHAANHELAFLVLYCGASIDVQEDALARLHPLVSGNARIVGVRGPTISTEAA